MFSNCSAGGIAIALIDICKTPPIALLICYTNIANKSEAVPNLPTIIIAGGPAHNINTIIVITFGDAPGAMGGVASGTTCGSSQHMQGSSKVMYQGAPVTCLTHRTRQNSTNAFGCSAVPSQLIVLILC